MNRTRAIFALLTVTMVVPAAASVTAASATTLVVDRDGVQCADAEFTSIQAAVDAAGPGDLIRVCPDLYTEAVVVDKALTIKAEPDAITGLGCFQPTLPELPPDAYAIVDPEGDEFSIGVELAADDVEFSGFVVQGASVGVTTSDGFSGYRIHHNLIRTNTLFAIDFGSEGTDASRVDHNCIRENRFGLVTELDDDRTWRSTNIDDTERARRLTMPRNLTNARIDHNSTFRNGVGLEAAGPGLYVAVTLDHNTSRQDRFGLAIQNSRESSLVANEISPTAAAIVVGGENSGLQILDNRVVSGLQALGFAAPTFFMDQRPLASTQVVVAHNSFTRLTAQAIVVRPDRLQASSLVANETSDSGDGIHLQAGNTGNTLNANLAERNARYGIWSDGPTANLFTSNTILDNATLDARDDNRFANTWTANQCVTDFPVGTICKAG